MIVPNCSTPPLLPPSPPSSQAGWRKCSQEALQTAVSSLHLKPTVDEPPVSKLRKSGEGSLSDSKTQQVATKVVATTTPSHTFLERYQRLQSSNVYNQSPIEKRTSDFIEMWGHPALARNRYDDVLPTPVDIVTLKQPTQSETCYINASRFENVIVTQGPFIKGTVIDTVADLWVMLFENGGDLVCLTDYINVSRGRMIEKTFPYWNPRDAGKNFSDHPDIVYDKMIGPEGKTVHLQVRLIEGPLMEVKHNEKGECVTKRVFEIKLDQQARRVTHWFFEHWQDQAICDEMQLVQLMKKLLNKQVTVHCSAGLGRAGVFTIAKLMIERMLKTQQVPTENEIDEAIVELRRRRPGAVQTKDQLELISKTIHAFIQQI